MGAGAVLQRSRDAATEAIENLRAFDLSKVTSSRVDRALNALRDHATDMDLKGVVREAEGALEGNHAPEFNNTLESMTNLKSSLMGALQNPNLPDEVLYSCFTFARHTRTREA